MICVIITMECDYMYDKIDKIIKNINVLSDIELKNIKIEVNNIINNNIIDKNSIEALFDRMLSLVFFDSSIIEPIYFRLLNYFKSIDTKSYNFYKELYNKQFEEEKVLRKLK